MHVQEPIISTPTSEGVADFFMTRPGSRLRGLVYKSVHILFSAHCTFAACPVNLRNSGKLFVDLRYSPYSPMVSDLSLSFVLSGIISRDPQSVDP